MSFQKCILDALTDDGESIVQIEGYFRHTTYKTNRTEIKDVMIQLLNDGLIQIVYPPNKTKENFIKSNSMTVEDFWFEQTKKGREIWEKS
jgi:hypothetical protein